MRIRELRFLTAVAISAVCLFAMGRGWNVVQFSPAQQFLSPDNRAQAVQRWVGYPGLNQPRSKNRLPLRCPLTQMGRAFELSTERMIQASPLSARYWLALSKTRRALEAGNDKAIAR